MFRRISLLLGCRPSEAYHRLVSEKKISSDPAQIKALPIFDRLYDDLEKYAGRSSWLAPPKRQVELRPPKRLGIIPSFFLRRDQEKKLQRAVQGDTDDILEAEKRSYHPLSHIQGLYVYGGVGSGKTMLMDILYDNAPQKLKKKRVHFHQFMLDVQQTTHNIQYKSNEEIKDSRRANRVDYNISETRRRTPEADINLFDELAQRMISDVELLCFDEVAVSDVAHAMILKRLFNAFYKMGIVVIFTSNRSPDDLYLGGLNRESFIPFINLVKKQNIVYQVISDTDHRLTGSNANTYFCPFNEENEKKFKNLYLTVSKALTPVEKKLRVFGRDVVVPRACGEVCYFYFNELCGEALSTADYGVIAKSFHTIFIHGVPRFPYASNDVKNRFLLLIDTFYEHRCKIVIYAEVEPLLLQATKKEEDEVHKLLDPAGDQDSNPLSIPAGKVLTEFELEMGKKLIDDHDGSFQMERCISRLYEMRTKEYLESPHKFEAVDLSTE